jgi:PPM family protein phosphatase
MLRVAEQYSGTDTGRQRRANEDALLARAPLFVVADGMGGAQAGEVASHLAVESFRRGLADADGDPERSLRARIHEANARIYELSRSNAEHAGMGTTLTALYVGDDDVSLAHVGDSRAYCLREGKLMRLTDDHSLVDELIRQGRLTPAEAQEHPQRSVITRALGPEPTVEVDTSTHHARAGDIYLVCSDGLTTMVPEAQVGAILSREGPLRESGEALLKAANEAGGRDNITVILFRLAEVTPGPASMRSTAGEAASSARASSMAAQAGAQATLDATTIIRRPRTSTPGADALPVSPLRPRLPTQAAPPPTSRRRKRWRGANARIALVVVLGLLLAGGYLATQSIYFIGTNGRGLVTIFSGLPYELPGGIKLYSSYYTSGVPASTVAPERRRTLLDNSWRSQGNATALVRSLELGQLAGQ